MDEAARTALPRALARAHRGRPDQGAHLQGHRRRHRHRRHRVLPAAVLRRRPRPSSTTSARRRRWRCTARSTRRCSASGPTRASATASCSTTRERPILPPEALFLKPEEFFGRCNAHAQLALRGSATTRDRLGRAPLPDLSVDRGAPEPLQPAAGPRRSDAAPRADRRRERRPAREPARAAARQPHRAAERGDRWPSSRPATSASRSPSAPLAAGFAWQRRRATRRSSSSPRPSCSRRRPARAGGASRSRPATSTR